MHRSQAGELLNGLVSEAVKGFAEGSNNVCYPISLKELLYSGREDDHRLLIAQVALLSLTNDIRAIYFPTKNSPTSLMT